MMHPADVLLVNGSQKIDTRGDFKLRLVSLDDCTNNSDVYVLSTDIMCRGNHSDVDI